MDIIKTEINDILDSNLKRLNFINNQPYSELFINLIKLWQNLPLYTNKTLINEFFNLLNEKQVILITSSTGSGKTVLIPKYVLKYIITLNQTGNVYITNPKKIITVENAKFGAKTLDVKLGEEVGYKHRGSSKKFCSDKSRLIYATDGVILSLILHGNVYLEECNTLIIDEAHERNVQIDLLLCAVKKIIFKRKDFKLIIMSATLNSDTFRNYFNVKGINFGELDISTKTNFPIEKFWLQQDLSLQNYLSYTIDFCLKLINDTQGDIIVFVPLVKDTIDGCLLLKEKCPNIVKIKTDCDKLFCVSFFSSMSDQNKELAVSKDLYKQNQYDRKIIFSTNVAESSITFDGLKYVLDTGLELLSYYDSKYNKEIIKKSYTSQANIKQRIGRVGRNQPGVSYHFYTEKLYNTLEKFPTPIILKTDFTNHLLLLIKTYPNSNDLIEFILSMITVPSLDQIISSLYKLNFIQAIVTNIDFKKINSINDLKNKKIEITNLGNNLAKLKSVDIFFAYNIIVSHYFKCQNEIIIIVAILITIEGQIKNLFKYSEKNKEKFFKYIDKYILYSSEHLNLLNIYEKLFKEKIDEYLNLSVFKNIHKLINKIKNNIENLNYDEMNHIFSNLEKINLHIDLKDKILIALIYSNKFNLLKSTDKKNYSTINYLNNSSAKINTSFIKVNNKSKPKTAIMNYFSEVFGRNEFKIITYIPDKYLKLLSI